MNPLGISVVRADESYGYAKYYYYEGPTVYIEITSINSSDNKWRVRGRASLGDDKVYLEGKGFGEYTFDSDDNMSYIFQIQNWNGDWVNTTNAYGDNEELSIINVNFESDSGGDSGDDGGGSGDDDDDGSGGLTGGEYYLWIQQANGTKLTVTRTYVDNSGFLTQGDYIGELTNGIPVENSDGLWYKHRVWNDDLFSITAEALPGYTIDTYYSDERYIDLNFETQGLTWGCNYDGTLGWNFDPDSTNIEPWIRTTATKNGSSSGDSGGNSGSSGSGTLYFDATQYGAQYAVEYSYDDDTFYVDSVKVKLAQYNSVWWAFNLTTKINDTVISSGSNNHFIDTWEWYDLGISGSAPVTDEVEVSLSGSAIHNNYQFNVASPTSQYVITSSGSSGGGGGGGTGDDDDDDGDDSGGSSGTVSGTSKHTVSQSINGRSITAEIYYDEGPEVTVKIIENTGAYWRVRGKNPDTTQYIPDPSEGHDTNANIGTFMAEDDTTYYFQAVWGDTSDGDDFKVNFSSGSGSGSGDGGNTTTARTLYLEQGDGTSLSVLFSDSSYYNQWKEFKGNTSAIMHYNGKDTIIITAEALDGYELDYYDFNGHQLGYCLENLEVYDIVGDTIYFQLASDGDARIISTAIPIATVHIYNKNNSSWDRYAPYIYNNSSGWERYTPYIYNNSSWDRYS